MRIGFLVPANYAFSGPANGVRQQAFYQAEALRLRGHSVLLLNPWETYDLSEFDVVQFFSGGFPHYLIEQYPRPMKQLVFAPIIDSNEPFWRYRLAARVGQRLRRFFTIPAILSDQARGSDLVIVRSEHERQRVIQGLGVNPEHTPVEIVLNGVPPPAPVDVAAVRERLKLPEKFLLHASVFSQTRKNVARLIEAVGPTELPLIIVGTPEKNAELDRLHLLEQRYPNVRILGFQDRATLNSLFAACRVFCLPSVHEGTGLAALEAASYGAGVVITRNGGPPDYFGTYGYYVDPESTSDIRKAVEAAWQEPRSSALQRHVNENLSWERSAEALESAYKKKYVGLS
jgi:glycosyltransferase involved in cell wall biosynthesis